MFNLPQNTSKMCIFPSSFSAVILVDNRDTAFVDLGRLLGIKPKHITIIHLNHLYYRIVLLVYVRTLEW